MISTVEVKSPVLEVLSWDQLSIFMQNNIGPKM